MLYFYIHSNTVSLHWSGDCFRHGYPGATHLKYAFSTKNEHLTQNSEDLITQAIVATLGEIVKSSTYWTHVACLVPTYNDSLSDIDLKRPVIAALLAHSLFIINMDYFRNRDTLVMMRKFQHFKPRGSVNSFYRELHTHTIIITVFSRFSLFHNRELFVQSLAPKYHIILMEPIF